MTPILTPMDRETVLVAFAAGLGWEDAVLEMMDDRPRSERQAVQAEVIALWRRHHAIERRAA